MVAKIGPFEVYELVGRGGMGSVYRGIDPMIGRTVALKIIRLLGYNDGHEASFLKERLFKEARAAGKLSHPSIVTIYHAGVQEDLAYIAMEYVDGPTLETRMASAGPLEFELLSAALLGTAAALDYAHERAVIHRDIKPGNVMFTSTGCVKVTDFGIAKTMLGHTTTTTGALLGTPYYMSPEQVQGRILDGRSDQFALAVIAYQMLTKRRPFHAEQVTSICYQIVHVDPPSPIDLNRDLNAGVSRTLSRGLAKDPAERFQTCTEFAMDLVEEYRHSLVHTPHKVVRRPDAQCEGEHSAAVEAKWPNRPRIATSIWVPWTVVLTCLSAIVLSLWLIWSHELSAPATQSFRVRVAPDRVIQNHTPQANPEALMPADVPITRSSGQMSTVPAPRQITHAVNENQ